jgi:hypothetical protein
VYYNLFVWAFVLNVLPFKYSEIRYMQKISSSLPVLFILVSDSSVYSKGGRRDKVSGKPRPCGGFFARDNIVGFFRA